MTGEMGEYIDQVAERKISDWNKEMSDKIEQ
jgi:hypothetical protein